jgi:hypothetical protein
MKKVTMLALCLQENPAPSVSDLGFVGGGAAPGPTTGIGWPEAAAGEPHLARPRDEPVRLSYGRFPKTERAPASDHWGSSVAALRRFFVGGRFTPRRRYLRKHVSCVIGRHRRAPPT